MKLNLKNTRGIRPFFIATGIALLFSASVHAQSCCSGGATMGWSDVSVQMGVDSGAELQEIDDPFKIINLTIVVHEKAKVTVNGEPTFTTGSVRQYVVRGAEPGKKYKFEVEGVFKNEFEAEYAAKSTVMVAAGGSDRVVLHLHRRNRPKPPANPTAPATLPADAVKGSK